jgi:hypothetical protein
VKSEDRATYLRALAVLAKGMIFVSQAVAVYCLWPALDGEFIECIGLQTLALLTHGMCLGWLLFQKRSERIGFVEWEGAVFNAMCFFGALYLSIGQGGKGGLGREQILFSFACILVLLLLTVCARKWPWASVVTDISTTLAVSIVGLGLAVWGVQSNSFLNGIGATVFAAHLWAVGGALVVPLLMAAGVMHVRKWQEKKLRKGVLGQQCLRCGYDLRGSIQGGQSFCSECGETILKRQKSLPV